MEITKKTMAKSREVKRRLLEEFRAVEICNKTVLARTMSISRAALFHRVREKKERGIGEANKQVIREFYCRNDVSTVYPTQWKSMKRSGPIHVLKQGGKKAYSIFKQEYPDISVSFSSFWSLRPKIVKMQSAGRWLQCLCDTCDNIEMLLKSIKGSFAYSSLAIPDQFLTKFTLVAATLCEPKVSRLTCLNRDCEKCGVKSIRDAIKVWTNQGADNSLSWQKWESINATYEGRSIKRLVRNTYTTTRLKAGEELISQLGSYATHCDNYFMQLNSYQQMIKSFSNHECVVVMDFAENFACQMQGEAQSAYYSRQQVTVHPMVVSIWTECGIIRDSVVVVSDDLKHDAFAVRYFVSILDGHLTLKYPFITKIIFWSDGCAAQYKSAKPFYNIAKNLFQHRAVEWNFFGSRHGKGPSDGESAVVKTFVNRIVQSGVQSIGSAREMFELLSNSQLYHGDGVSRRHFYFAKEETIDQLRSTFQKKISPVTGTRKVHQITAGPGYTSVRFRRLTCLCLDTDTCVHEDNQWTVSRIRGEYTVIVILDCYHCFLSNHKYMLNADS